jgi:fructose-1,6-bisphosphatase/inositol monophosphatase family enzyme/GNAT superfamily N-acetyltransferase
VTLTPDDAPPVTVRPVAAGDAAAVAALVRAMGGHGDLGDDGLAERLGRLLDDPVSRALAADVGDTVVGVVVVQARTTLSGAGREAWVDVLAVAPGDRGRGVGRVLIEAADATAVELGCTRLVLECAATRVDAHRFYESIGFLDVRPVGRRLGRPVRPSAADLADRFLAVAAQAATAVSGVIGPARGRRPVGLGADGDETKAADRAAELVALAHLTELGVPVCSEEAGLVGGDPGDGWWIALDPLDGTRNFEQGLAPYAFACGLVHGAEPVAGLVVELTSGRRWSAAPGRGALADGRPCRPRPGPLVAVPSAAPGSPATFPFDGFERVRMSGSTTVDLCRVADGSLGGFADLDRGVVHVHDLAGPMAVLRQAGVPVVDPDGGDLRLRPDPAWCTRLLVGEQLVSLTPRS